jgi:hypothetical protein
MLRKDPTNLKGKRIHYSEEHPLNRRTRAFCLFLRRKKPHRTGTTSPLSIICLQKLPVPRTFDIKPNSIGPIMTSILMAQTQVVANKAKEYGINKPTPFTDDRTKIRQFLQDCLGYLDMNQGIYNTDRLKIGFILSCINDGKATN